MRVVRRAWLALLLGCVTTWAAGQPPALMLAGEHRPGLSPADYWISEKLDGVRARWDGARLISRGGHVIAAPAWFTRHWPDTPLDGELWAGRGQFEATVSTVRRDMPQDEAWQALRFMVFDLPAHGGSFSERVADMQRLNDSRPSPWLQVVEQRRGSTGTALQRELAAVVKAGGEGLMLHRGTANYRAGRSEDIVKLKPFDDAEAQVMAHLPGQGRNSGLVGALQVRSADGRRFRLGSGLSDAQRRDPPALGSWVTYRYQGLTEKGLPRFARFLRVRADADLNLPRSPS